MTVLALDRRRAGSALVWTALVLALLPVAAVVIVDVPAVVAAWQSGEAALTEAWQATGRSDRFPSSAQLATMTDICAQTLPSDVSLSTPVVVVDDGLSAQMAVRLPLPLLNMRTTSVTLTLPIAWTP
jgi:Flp pilus assembly protein TadG